MVNKVPLLVLFIFFQILISTIFYLFILNDNTCLNSFVDKFDLYQIEKMIEINRKYSWVSLVLNPILYVFKLILISVSIYFVKLISGEDFKAIFSHIFFNLFSTLTGSGSRRFYVCITL